MNAMPVASWPLSRTIFSKFSLFRSRHSSLEGSLGNVVLYIIYPIPLAHLLIISFPRIVRQFIIRRSTMPYVSLNGWWLVVLWRKHMESLPFESYQFIPMTLFCTTSITVSLWAPSFHALFFNLLARRENGLL